MKFKRTRVVITSALLSAALLTSGMPLAAYADTDDLQQRVNEAYATLQSYTMELELAGSQLAQVQDDLAAVREQIAQTQEEIVEKKKEVEEGQAIIAERTSTTYKQGGASLLAFVLGSSDFSDLFSRIFYANKVADADAQVIDQVKSDMEILSQKEEELAEQEAQQEELVAEQEQKTAEVAQKVARQGEYYNGLDNQLKEQLAQEEARRAAEEAARKAAEEEAKRQEQENNGGSNNSGNSGNSGNNGGSSGTTTPPSENNNTNSGNSPSSVVDVALAQVGKAYVWGASGPNSFDCSGLTSYAYRQVGISIPHQSQSQLNLVRSKGHLVYDISNLKAGDLVFWGYGGSADRIYHVGIYIGGGRYVHASMPGVGVVTGTLYASGNYVGGGSPV